MPLLMEHVRTLNIASWQTDIRVVEAQIDIEWLTCLQGNDRIRLPTPNTSRTIALG